jgi:hypothetical protein
MANSSTYLVQTRNRCVVGVYGDTVGGITFGITASAFTNGMLSTANDGSTLIDTRINNSSASLSRIAYGVSGSSVVLGYGHASGVSSVAFVLTQGTNQIDLERFTIPNGLTTNANGLFYMNIPAATTVTAYLEFVPF